MASLTPKQLAIRGVLWVFSGFGASQVLRLATNLVITRLLEPEFFGLINLAGVFVTGLTLFLEFGLETNITRHKDGDDPTFLNTAWTIQVLRGVAVFVLCAIVAYPLSTFYKEPRIVWVLPFMAFTGLVGGFRSMAIPRLNRNMQLGPGIMLDLIGQIIGASVVITWAFFNKSVLAILFGGLISSCITVFLSFKIVPDAANRFCLDRYVLKELFHFGKWLTVTTMLGFGSGQVDRLTLGKLLPLSFLGVYGIAGNLADVPRSIATTVAYKVLFPSISKAIDAPREEFTAKLLKQRGLLLLAVTMCVAFVSSFGDVAVHILYDKRYTQAAILLPLITLGIWPSLLSMTATLTLLALGKPSYETAGSLSKLIFTGVGIPLSYHFFGLLGTMTVIVLNDIPMYIFATYGLLCEKINTIKQDIQITLLLAVIVAGISLIRASLGFGYAFDSIMQLR